jgi:Mn-containing catalase
MISWPAFAMPPPHGKVITPSTTFQFPMTREITHMKAFAAALASMGKDPFTIGQIRPTPGIVDQYFNDSTGKGDAGEDFRGPWNQGGSWQHVEAPAFKELRDKTGLR